MKSQLFLFIHAVLFFFLPFREGYAQFPGPGNTLQFNGNTRGVNLGSAVCDSVRTIELWFRLNAAVGPTNTDVHSLIVRDFENGNAVSTNEFGLFLGYPGLSGGELWFYRRVGSTEYAIKSDRNVWNANRWYHVAGVIYPGDGMQLFINGVPQQDAHPSTEPILPVGNTLFDEVWLGKWGYPQIRHFNGDIDEVRIWTQARSQAEIREKMCMKISLGTPGLRAYYRFDESQGISLPDLSGNGFDGSLSGFSGGNSWVFSGAPVGDTSAYFYAANWAGNQVELALPDGLIWGAKDITSSAEGVHVYRVSDDPNSQTGIPGFVPGQGYFGVFMTRFDGRYNPWLDYSARSNCQRTCLRAFTRNDNTYDRWSQLNSLSRMGNCRVEVPGESTVGDFWRAEYWWDIRIDSLIPVLPDTVTRCFNDSVVLDAEIALSGAAYIWSTGATSSTITVNRDGIYTVEISSPCGRITDQVWVIPGQYREPQVPNVFTPNGDGNNDVFRVDMETAGFYHLKILNRWGNILFTSDNPQEGWDGRTMGKPASEGVYYYTIVALDCMGERKEFKGTVTLMR